MIADCLTADSLTDGLPMPPGDGPNDAQRYGCGPNPVPPAIDAPDPQPANGGSLLEGQ